MQNPFRKLRDALTAKTGENHSQHDIAVLAGFTANAIGQWERFESVPNINKVDHLAGVYQTTADEIVQAILASNRFMQSQKAETASA